MDVNIIGAIKCYLTRSEDPNLQRSHADNLRRSVSTEGQTDFRSVAFHRGSLQTASLSTEEFFKFEHATECGLKDAMFIMSHLASFSIEYARQVYKSGVPEMALDLIWGHTKSKSGCSDRIAVPLLEITPDTQQTVESACRLVWSVADEDESSEDLVGQKNAVQLLLRSLKISLEHKQVQISSKLVRTLTTVDRSQSTDADKAPLHGHKMRAALALNILMKRAEAPDLVRKFIDDEVANHENCEEFEYVKDQVGCEHRLIWLVVEPELKKIFGDYKKRLYQLSDAAKKSKRYSQEWAIFDIALALLANEEDCSLNELLLKSLPSQSGHIVLDKVREIFPRDMSSNHGHRQCAWWSVLCKALKPLCEPSEHPRVLEIADGKLAQMLLSPLLGWLQGGHPYKSDAADLLGVLVMNQQLADRASETIKLEGQVSLNLMTDAGEAAWTEEHNVLALQLKNEFQKLSKQ